MKRSDILVLPAHYDTYINKCEDVDIVVALEQYGRPVLEAERGRLAALGNHVYAPDKWTARDVLQHLIDVERVFAYRALRYARKDTTVLPAFDENAYAVTAQASKRSLDDLLEEFYAVRNASMMLFKSFDEEMLMQEGKIWSGAISVLALGFAIVGHVNHHIDIFRERYFVGMV